MKRRLIIGNLYAYALESQRVKQLSLSNSTFRFSIRSLLLLALHCSVIAGTLSVAVRSTMFEVTPLLRFMQSMMIPGPGILIIFIMFVAAFAPLLSIGLVSAIVVRQFRSPINLTSAWYYVAFAMGAIFLPTALGYGVPRGWEFVTRMWIVLSVTTIAGFLEARIQKPSTPAEPSVDLAYGGDVPVLIQKRRQTPRRYGTPLLMAIGTFAFWCFLVGFEAMVSV